VRRFGWMRLACLLLILTVLAALVRDGGAEARSLAARLPDAMFLAPESPEEPPVTPRTEGQLSAIEDLSEDALQMDAGIEPRPRPVPEKEEQKRPVGEKVRAASPSEPPSEPPVFYRPAGPDTPEASGPVCGDLRDAPKGGRIVFPLERRFYSSYEDTWGAPRTQGGHEGTDLMTPSGVPEYAITDGTVVPIAGSDAEGWNSLGGHAVMVRADYSMGPVEAGDLFYYAHLERESPLRIGARVSAGQVVGYAGDTGQGPPGTSGLFPPHLHLGWYDGTGGREEAPSGAMNPYPLLEWIRSNGGAVTGDSEARFCEAPRTGPPTPSAQDGSWPTPANPGLSPDLDTNPGDPNPNRGAREIEREEEASAKKPPTPDRPKKARNEPPAKSPDGNRSQAPKPDRPDKDPQGTVSPDPGEDQRPKATPEPPEKDPPKPGPTDDQYAESTTGGPSGAPEAPRPNDGPKPKTHEQNDADKDASDSSKPSQQETPPGQATDRNP
jgi:murein DD-endopeptidase MepM/ murein hydrolase activator NlpD